MADVIVGKSGKNKLTALENKTQVYGLAGNDTLSSNGKNEILLVGGSGNDVLNMTGGSGTLSGGKGKDTFNLAYSSKQKISAVIEDIDPTNDKIIITYDGDAPAQLNYSIDGDDVIWTDDKGYFSVTLKGSSDASDYYEGTANEYIWDILRIVNQERENRNLSPLTLSQGLMDGMAIREKELAELYSHTRPDGSSCFTAVKKSYSGMGENIAYGYASPEDVMNGWMNSAGHRANILNDGYKKLGVGYYYSSKKYWGQMFGGNLSSPDTISTDKILNTSISLKGAKILTDTAKNADPITNKKPKVTINGSADNDFITSEADNVKINGGDGNDSINVAQTEDYDWDAKTWVYTTYNKAAISGGKGADSITNYNNQAVIDGGAGSDKIFNHGDNSTVQAASGNNLVVNGEYFGKGGTNVNISVGSGNDTITNSGSNSMLNGGAGDDVIYNGYYYYAPWNAFYENGGGSEYNDALGSSNVTIDSGEGKDTIYNNGSQVTIDGGAGNDFIKNNGEKILFKYTKGDGNDFIRGFGKNDTLSIAGSTYSTLKDFKDIIVKVGEGKITLEGAVSLDNLNIMSDFLAVNNSTKSPVTIASTIKTVDASERTKAVKITGNALANSIVGGKGNDSLLGGKGNDSLNGGSGNDTLTGGGGNDIFIYTAGKDVITDYSADDKISLGAAISKTTLNGSDVVFTLGKGSLTVKKGKGKTLNIIDSAGKKYSTVVGGTTLTLTNAATSPVTAASTIKVIDASKRTKAIKITGNKLANTISGGSKNDSLYGAAGNDKLFGGKGNDILIGGKGNDSLWGDAGADKFIYASGDGKDVIFGFDNKDTLTLDNLDFTASHKNGVVTFKVDSGSVTLKDFTATTFHVNNDVYHISGKKLVK